MWGKSINIIYNLLETYVRTYVHHNIYKDTYYIIYIQRGIELKRHILSFQFHTYIIKFCCAHIFDIKHN